MLSHRWSEIFNSSGKRTRSDIPDITSSPQAESLHQIRKDTVALAKDVGFEEVVGNDGIE